MYTIHVIYIRFKIIFSRNTIYEAPYDSYMLSFIERLIGYRCVLCLLTEIKHYMNIMEGLGLP